MARIGVGRGVWSLGAVAIGSLAVLASAPAYAASTADCHVGAYRLASGAAVDIAPSEGDTLR